MIYFSELKEKKVLTEDGIQIGRLSDLIFFASETAEITKLVIVDDSHNKIIIPTSFVKKFGRPIIINKHYVTIDIQENELYVLKNVLDKQIIDLKGSKVVRVNDVVIQDKPGYFIAGVDIGLLGIMRWFGLEYLYTVLRAIVPLKVSSQFLSWGDIQPLELARGKVQLNIKQEKLENVRPADLADYLEKTNIKNITHILELLDKSFSTKVIAELNPNYQIALLKRLDIDKTAKIISYMDQDEAVDLLTQFSEKRRQQILQLLDTDKRKSLEYLLKYIDTAVGPYLNGEFLTVRPEETAAQVISKINKNTSGFSILDYVYVTNQNNQLVGVFNLHELLLQDFQNIVYRFMTQNMIVTHIHSPVNTVMRKMMKYHLNALPVVDVDKQILGIVQRETLGMKYIDRI